MRQDQLTLKSISVQSVLILFALSVIFCLSGCDSFSDWRTYSKAQDAFEMGDFQTAFQVMETIPDYKDPKNIRSEITYGYASYLFNVKRFSQAVPLFERIPDYKDSKQRIQDTYLGWAEKMTALGNHAKAVEIYKKIGQEDRASSALLDNVEAHIEKAEYEQALKLLENIEDSEQSTDFRSAAEKGTLYLEAKSRLAINDFSTARKLVEKAVKIKHKKRLLFQDEYLATYCSALKPVITRLGSEKKYPEVLAAVYPVYHLIQSHGDPECQDCVRIGEIAGDQFFFAETSRSDWQHQIERYRTAFPDQDVRCNIFGGLALQHYNRTKRMINVLLAFEEIKDECTGANAPQWEEAVKQVELSLSTMVLDWKRNNNFKKIMILQEYITTNLKGIPLEMGSWGALQENDLMAEYKFSATDLGKNKLMVAGFVKNPSNYRPILVSGVKYDCSVKGSAEIKVDCGKSVFNERILPGQHKTMNSQSTAVNGFDKVVDYDLLWKFEEVNIDNITAKDIFSKD